jgi:hypothetical protein
VTTPQSFEKFDAEWNRKSEEWRTEVVQRSMNILLALLHSKETQEPPFSRLTLRSSLI